MMGGNCVMSGLMGQGQMGQGMMDQGRMGQGMMGQGHSMMGAMTEGRLAYLKAEMDISDAQIDAWNDYADAVRVRVGLMDDMRPSMMDVMQNGSMTERMNARIAAMEAMVGAMKAVQPATEALYSTLNDDQKRMADQLMGMGCGAM